MHEDMIKQLVDKFWNAIIYARNNGKFQLPSKRLITNERNDSPWDCS